LARKRKKVALGYQNMKLDAVPASLVTNTERRSDLMKALKTVDIEWLNLWLAQWEFYGRWVLDT
jgi:hypothetical protein